MKNLNLCLLPLRIEWGEEKKNLSELESCLSLVHPDTDIVVVPETFSTGFPVGMTREEVRKLARKPDGETVSLLKELSSKHGVALAGSFIAVEGGGLFNRGFFVEPSGEVTFSDKRHLFSMAGEEKIFTRGEKRLKVRFRGWNIALFICYDLRFPVWSRNISNEYDLALYVANWPEVRIDAWNKLLPARAIENLAYSAGVDCSGRDPKGFEYDGSSHIFDFKGQEISVVMENPDGTRFVYASLSKEKLERFREKFPAFNDSDPFRIL